MDFFEQQDRARRQTTLLLVYFAAAVVMIVVLTYIIFASIVLPFLKPLPHGPRIHHPLVSLCWLLGEAVFHPGYYLRWTWDPRLFAGFAAGATLTIVLGSLFKIRQLAAGGPVVAELLGGRRVEPSPAEPDEQKLRNVIEEMAVASGMPVPEVYVLDNERGINAFAAGHTQSDVAIGVTRGCLKLLNRDELQGVIAHEFSHILNGDTRLNMRLMGIAHGVLWPVIVGRVLVRGSNRPAEPGESILDEDASVTRLPFIPIGYVLLAIGSIGLPFVRLIKSAICREREWLADAAAVQFTRYPAGIAGALKQIGGLYKQGRLDTPHAETASHLYFANSSFTPWFGFLSTHPPLAKRILAIDPAFDGQFPKVASLPPSQFEREQRFDNAVALVMAAEKANPGAFVSGTGSLTVEHIRRAAAVRLGLPNKVTAACRSPTGAMAIIYTLLLSSDESTRAGQLELLGRKLDAATLGQTTDLLPEAQSLDPRVKLPLIDLTLPALRHLEEGQYLQFAQFVQELIEYDQAIDLFEYTLQKILFRHLRCYYEPTPNPGVCYSSLKSLLAECSLLLSALAHIGQEEEPAVAAAFQRGAGFLDVPEGAVHLLSGEACSLARVDSALDRLAQASASTKRNVLLACAQTVAADGQVLYREAELLRAIADALDCPVPPFVEALESQQSV
ncbi:MAG: M48 family metallopeptidase [Verrucomicrobiota bacterium]|jgi:Zn-dependent protease with chaperone function